MTRVLYAEDDPQLAEMVRMTFEFHAPDIELEIATGGIDCLAAMERGGYDLLLLDLMMPDIDGLQVLGKLTARRDPTPVIMVSAHGQYEVAVRALRAGAVDCIDKTTPDFRRIHEIIASTLARRGQPRPKDLPTTPSRSHRVLFLDPLPQQRQATSAFLSQSASHLQFTTDEPTALDALLRKESSFDAVVLGPNWATVPMLDALRHLRGLDEDIPVVVIAKNAPGETAVAAFKLGVYDYLLHHADWMAELVFSLNHALKLADIARDNAKLSDELARINRSLADEVTLRTHELENEVKVRRNAEHRAQDLAARLIDVQENERRVIAQELHDQIGQLLTGLRFQLEAAKNVAPLTEALAITDDLLRSVRSLTLSLRPLVLDDLGLAPALDWHIKQFSRQTGIAVHLEHSLPAARLPRALEVTAYRVVQEALTNVARHSGATTAEVALTTSETILHLEISDRGRGFDAQAALARRDSLGLAGLAERVRLAGGELEIFSQSGRGTRIHAEFGITPATP